MAKRSTQIQKLLRQIGKEDIFPPNRKSRTVEPKKPNRPTFKKGIPAALEGADGDITIREVEGKGVFYYIKNNGSWLQTALSTEIQESIINSSTGEGDILLYDKSSEKYIPKRITGDVELNSSGLTKIKHNSLNSEHIASRSINRDLIGIECVSQENINKESITCEQF